MANVEVNAVDEGFAFVDFWGDDFRIGFNDFQVCMTLDQLKDLQARIGSFIEEVVNDEAEED